MFSVPQLAAVAKLETIEELYRIMGRTRDSHRQCAVQRSFNFLGRHGFTLGSLRNYTHVVMLRIKHIRHCSLHAGIQCRVRAAGRVAKLQDGLQTGMRIESSTHPRTLYCYNVSANCNS